MFLKVLPPTTKCSTAIQSQTNLPFSPCSSVKHHYIFITRRQMTETEREEEIWTRQQRRNSSGVFLWDIWLHCLNLPFIYCLVVKTQLRNSYKWTFDLTIRDLIGTLDVPQTSSWGLGGVWERLRLEVDVHGRNLTDLKHCGCQSYHSSVKIYLKK